MYLKPASFTLTHFQMEQNLLDAYALIKHAIGFQSVWNQLVTTESPD